MIHIHTSCHIIACSMQACLPRARACFSPLLFVPSSFCFVSSDALWKYQARNNFDWSFRKLPCLQETPFIQRLLKIYLTGFFKMTEMKLMERWALFTFFKKGNIWWLNKNTCLSWPKLSLFIFFKEAQTHGTYFPLWVGRSLGIKGDLCLFYMASNLVFPTLQCRLHFCGNAQNYLFYKTLSIVISHNNSDFWLLLINHIV